MTVSTLINKISYSASGSQDTFAYPFKVFSEDDLLVYVRVSQTDILKTNYTVTGVGNDEGGNIIFIAPYKPSAGQVVTIIRQMDIVQGTDYVPNDPFPAEVHEDALDYRTMCEQQINEKITRSITAPITDQATSLELPNEEVRADRYLIFDSDGNVTTSLTTISGGQADHGVLAGLTDDDHEQYLLASQATDRATFTTNWTDLTDGGNSTLHIHDSRYYTESEVDDIETALDNKIDTASGTLQSQITANTDALAALDDTYATDAELAAASGTLNSKIDTTSGTLQGQIDGLTIDHGELTGLSDDDHLQYLLRTDFTTYSGSMVADWQAADSALDTKVDTASGTLQTQINNISTNRIEYDANNYIEVFPSQEIAVVMGGGQVLGFDVNGTTTYSGLDVYNNTITSVGTPVNPQDAANKSYVDTVSGTLQSQMALLDNTKILYDANNYIEVAPSQEIAIVMGGGQVAGYDVSGFTVYSGIDIHNGNITSLADPINSTDGANKNYVDTHYTHRIEYDANNYVEVAPSQEIAIVMGGGQVAGFNTSGMATYSGIDIASNDIWNVNAVYFSNKNFPNSGDWRITTSGTDLVRQKYNGATWDNVAW